MVIVITAFSSIEGAIDAMREGAFHYIPKPFKNEEVLLTVRKALEQRRLAAENRSLREQLAPALRLRQHHRQVASRCARSSSSSSWRRRPRATS